MPTAPTPITPYGPPPNSNDPVNFDARADAKVAQDVIFVGEANALADNVYANALEAEGSAQDAAADRALAQSAALQATTAASAPAWVSGTTYAIGDVRWAPGDNRIYRRRTVGAGVTDPSLDPTNWGAVSANGLQLASVAGNSATLGANTDTCFTGAPAWAATVPLTGVGDAFIVRGDNGRRDNTVDLGARSVIGPNGVVRSGVITLNDRPYFALRWWGDYYRSF